MTTRHLLSLLLILFLAACGRQEGTGGNQDGDPFGQAGDYADPLVLFETDIDVPIEAVWVNTGLRLRGNQRIAIAGQTASGFKPVGHPVPNKRAPVPIFGDDGLIGRIGEDGFPFPIPDIYEVQGSSLSEGEYLFVGRNVAPPQPFVGGTQEADAAATDTASGAIVNIPYTPESYIVRLTVRQTDAPAVLTPIDGFYGNNSNPIFDWDEIDNASQYNLDMSDFPDFRRVIFSINVATTSINTATFQIDPTNPGAPVNPNLAEGLYYWRVRAQVNDGRLLNPNLTWTDRSVIFRIGVETADPLPPPELLTPSGLVAVDTNTVIPFEVLAIPDASGLEWRYRFFSAGCGDVIDPSDNQVANLASPWMVFQQTYTSNRIDLPERLYASFSSPILSQGSWLLRVDTRDGADQAGVRLGALDYEFHVSCD